VTVKSTAVVNEVWAKSAEDSAQAVKRENSVFIRVLLI
jgi:hypothetical protein